MNSPKIGVNYNKKAGEMLGHPESDRAIFHKEIYVFAILWLVYNMILVMLYPLYVGS